MQRSCEECGKLYEAQRSSARYCSSSCRSRHSQKPKRPAAPVATDVDLVATVRDSLAAAGRMGTPLGDQALVLARRMSAQGELGSSVASLSRELRAVMVEALADASSAVDPLDELRARRDRKRTG